MVFEPLEGFRFITRYFSDASFNIGIDLSLGRMGVNTGSYFNKEKEEYKPHHKTYAIRLGAYDRNLFKGFFEAKKNIMEIDLFGPVKYQRYPLFDRGNKFLSLIKEIDNAKKDPVIGGIALNLSGIEINKELLWELREKLKDFKTTGKKE